MKEARIHSADELLPLWKYLLEKGEKLNLTDLELKKQTMFQIDNVCKVINFQVLKRLVLRETRMYVEQDGENIWKFLTNVEGIRLKTLYTDAEYESLNGFLKSFKGLEELFLCDVDKRWLPSTDEFFSTITLSQGRTLKRFFYGRDVHGSNYLDANLIRKFIFGCPNLEELGFAMREEDMV